MGVCSNQPLAQGKGVHREMESEGSRRQSSGPRNTNSIAHVNYVKYLGYSFYIYRGEGRHRIHPKSVVKFKDKVREVTGRSNGMGIEERKSRLNSLVQGWMNYFKLADARKLLEG
jgi:RNA-directed DNA polymerase